MDAGLGDAEFLDELIPVEEWATDGQRPTRKQPQNGDGPSGENSHQRGEKGPQPQAPAEPLAGS